MPIRKLIVAAGGTWVVRAGGAVIGESAQAVELSRKDGPGMIYFPREDLGHGLPRGARRPPAPARARAGALLRHRDQSGRAPRRRLVLRDARRPRRNGSPD